MYGKLITTIIGICVFFGMLIFAGNALKDTDIGLHAPEANANPQASETTVPASAQPDTANQPNVSNPAERTDSDESLVFYDVENPGEAKETSEVTAHTEHPQSEASFTTDTTPDITAQPTEPTPDTTAALNTDAIQPTSGISTKTVTNNAASTSVLPTPTQSLPQSNSGTPQIDPKYIDILLQAEANAHTAAAKRVLHTARKMALTDKEIIQGSCWDYINAVYHKAALPQAKRRQLFNGEYKTGPYADQDLFQPADWLYFVNHSYKDIEHSSLFIGWTNRQKNEALMLTYGGENRKEPARYRVYDLSHVYGIIRPSSQPVKPLR